MLHVLKHPHPSRRRLLTAISVCAAIVPLALLNGQESSAQTQLDTVRARQERIRNELADENAAVDAALARAGVLRTRELEVNAELSAKEAELASARELLAQQRAALAETKRHLRAALGDLKRLLVFIYKNGEVDETQVLLDADGMDDLATRAEYLGRINDFETKTVERVKRLRAETAEKVGSTEDTVARIGAARDAIEVRRQRLASARAAADQREAELRAVRDDRREVLADLIGKEKHLVDVLSTPDRRIAIGCASERLEGNAQPRRHCQRAGQRACGRKGGDRRGQRDHQRPVHMGRRPWLLRVRRIRLLRLR